MIRSILIAALAALSAGCTGVSDLLINEAYCGDSEEMVAVSWYGPLGVGAKLGPKSAQRYCQPPASALVPQLAAPGPSAADTIGRPVAPVLPIAPIVFPSSLPR